jgi:hypothetical protein
MISDMQGKAARLDKTIARTAGRQLGVVTRTQLASVGVTRYALHRRIVSGRLVRTGTNAFVIAGTPKSWEQTALAACLDAGPGALVSHRSAAVIWQLGLNAGDVVEVTVPYARRGGHGGTKVVVHRSRSLTKDDGTLVGRVPVTRVARTLVDLASVVEPELLARCADEALCRRLLSPSQMREAIDRLARGGRPGLPHLRKVIGSWLAGTEVESVAEGEVLRALHAAGLPAPATGYQVVASEDGFVARLDFAWPDQLVALEVDGFRWHANPAAQVHDAARANRLAARGWIVLRTTPAEFRAGRDHVIAALSKHLGACEPNRRV